LLPIVPASALPLLLVLLDLLVTPCKTNSLLLLLLLPKLLLTACSCSLLLLLVLLMILRAVLARDVSTASLLMVAAMADEALPCLERACTRATAIIHSSHMVVIV
jgi:hypothetical protein